MTDNQADLVVENKAGKPAAEADQVRDGDADLGADNGQPKPVARKPRARRAKAQPPQQDGAAAEKTVEAPTAPAVTDDQPVQLDGAEATVTVEAPVAPAPEEEKPKKKKKKKKEKNGDKGKEKSLKKYRKDGRLNNAYYEAELARLQEELVKLQYWVKEKELRVLIIFEGRGSAGKGGVIKRLTERSSPRIVRVAALPKPTDRERTQWYFQRYVTHLPAGGEIVLFDRSWYNRSNVESVMGFASEREVQEFLRSCPQFERMLVRSGIILLKYWFSISYEEQTRRFESRNREPLKRWKLSEMDLAEHRLFTEYSKAKDLTFDYTDIKQAPWYVVPSDDKKKARLNCISHILSMIPYEDVVPEPVVIPEKEEISYIRPPIDEQTFVPQIY